MRMAGIARQNPADGYPPEEGCHLRGNDYSPVAVLVILKWMREKTPPDIERLIRVSVERGAALAGTLQTENVGLEKVICNIVANPNIRYLVVCGPEPPLGGKITWRVTHPEREPKTDEERRRRAKLREMKDRVRKSVEKRSKDKGIEGTSSSHPARDSTDSGKAPTAVAVLFACVHNAGRSQMAAAFFNVLADPGKARAISGGMEPGDRVHPEVVEVMKGAGIDLSSSKPQKLTLELARGAHLLVTMGCGEACPHLPGLAHEDWPLEDPKGKSPDQVREIREAVRERVKGLISARGWEKF